VKPALECGSLLPLSFAGSLPPDFDTLIWPTVMV
jgi:hypothetical protein